MSYANWCVAQNSMKHTSDAMASLGLNVSETNVPGQAGPLRFAEGVDSIQNIVNSANAETNSASAGYLLCSITQAGGLLYFFIVMSIVSALLVVIPCLNFFSQLLYDAGCVVAATAAASSVAKSGEKEADVYKVKRADLSGPAVSRSARLASFLKRRAEGAYKGAKGAARGAARAGVGTVKGVYRARNLPRNLPGFGLSQKIAVRGGIGLNKAAFYGARGAARGTARGAIGIGPRSGDSDAREAALDKLEELLKSLL